MLTMVNKDTQSFYAFLFLNVVLIKRRLTRMIIMRVPSMVPLLLKIYLFSKTINRIIYYVSAFYYSGFTILMSRSFFLSSLTTLNANEKGMIPNITNSVTSELVVVSKLPIKICWIV